MSKDRDKDKDEGEDEVTINAKQFIEQTNKAYACDMMAFGGNFSALSIRRLCSGVVDLDIALGGGWPFSRLAIIAGEESTGKTLIAIKACVAVEEYDHATKRHRDFVPEKEFTPGTALFVDIEGAFDIDWAARLGFNPEHHVVCRPEYAEQAVDIVTRAIHENVFDLIIIDSIAAMTPVKEILESSEDAQMGLAARIINKAMRRWNSSLNKMSSTSIGGPAILCLNQFRIDIMKTIGDPRTMPGGRGQKFCASIIVYNTSPKIEDDEKETAFVKLSGYTKKNKTYIVNCSFTYKMALRDVAGWKTGEVNNLKRLVELGKKHDIVNTDKAVTWGDIKTKTQKALAAKLAEEPMLMRTLWRQVVTAATAKS